MVVAGLAVTDQLFVEATFETSLYQQMQFDV